MNGVKMEEDTKVKPEPDSPDLIGEEDSFEDTGELQIPASTAHNSGWLTQIPKDLWTALAHMLENSKEEDITIGQVKVWSPQEGQRDAKQVVRFTIDPKLAGFPKTVPRDYDMNVHNQDVRNIFVFSEKNVKGYQPGGAKPKQEKAREPNTGRKTGGSWRVEKRRGPRTIPKHTALFTVPDAEVRATPRENDEWHRIQAMKVQHAEVQPDEDPYKGMTIDKSKDMDRLSRAIGHKSSWMGLTTAKPITKKSRTQDNKAARIPETELMDQLFSLFNLFPYYPMKVIKQKTRQPEAYLREVLSKIGRLVKKGAAANTWTLKEEWARAKLTNWDTFEGKEENDDVVKMEGGLIANTEEGTDADDGEEDDDEEMENVDI